MTKRKQALIAFVVFDFLLAVVFVGLFLLRSSTDNSQSELSNLGVALLPDQPQLSEFELVDHHGMAFTNQNLKDKWNLIFFGFTSCPDVCPLTMNALQLFYEDLEAGDIRQSTSNISLSTSNIRLSTRVVMISVDPERDSVEKMADYVNSYHEDFIGLTGLNEEISKLASQLYIAYTEPPSHSDHSNPEDQPADYEVQHSGYIAIIDPEGNYKGVVRAPHTRQSISNAYFAVRDI